MRSAVVNGSNTQSRARGPVAAVPLFLMNRATHKNGAFKFEYPRRGSYRCASYVSLMLPCTKDDRLNSR